MLYLLFLGQKHMTDTMITETATIVTADSASTNTRMITVCELVLESGDVSPIVVMASGIKPGDVLSVVVMASGIEPV